VRSSAYKRKLSEEKEREKAGSEIVRKEKNTQEGNACAKRENRQIT
jgi:hypothetical protein